MRFTGAAYRAHDPQWSFLPTSGEGARLKGGRFSEKGVPALYLALDFNTAVLEANQGFAYKILPTLLCSYDVDCADIVDLTSPAERSREKITLDQMGCAWFDLMTKGEVPPSWEFSRRLRAAGAAGIVVPSYVVHAPSNARNIVLWDWSDTLPHRINVIDPKTQLPKDRKSWQ